MQPKVAVAIVSGGMDSVTLAHLMVLEGYDLSGVPDPTIYMDRQAAKK